MPATRPLGLHGLAVLAGFRSLAELARATDISLSYIYNIRAGYKPSSEKLQRLAAALDVSERKLLKAIRHDG